MIWDERKTERFCLDGILKEAFLLLIDQSLQNKRCNFINYRAKSSLKRELK